MTALVPPRRILAALLLAGGCVFDADGLGPGTTLPYGDTAGTEHDAEEVGATSTELDATGDGETDELATGAPTGDELDDADGTMTASDDDEATDAEDASEASDADDDGPPPIPSNDGPYGPCKAWGSPQCFGAEICAQSSQWHVCTMVCQTASECPAAPGYQVRCLESDLTPPGVKSCSIGPCWLLDSACPPGMVCRGLLPTFCAWP